MYYCNERLISALGIDVQAELKSITGPAQGRVPHSIPQPTPAQRAMMNQHQNTRRAASGPSPRHLQAQKSSSSTATSQSPQLQPTPTSQTSSPVTSKSPNFAMQGAMLSSYPGLQAQQQAQQTIQTHAPPPPPPPPSSRGNTYPPIRPYPGPPIVTSNSGLQSAPFHTSSRQSIDARSSAIGPRSNPWPSPFQTHIEQLGKLTPPPLPFHMMELCSS